MYVRQLSAIPPFPPLNVLLIRGSLQHFFTLVNKVSFTLVSTTGEGKQDFFALKGAGGGRISEKLNFVSGEISLY